MSFYLVKPKYKLVGHRGVAALKPENTLEGFKYSAELGLNWIETDARLTKDGVWVIMHDPTLDRTTNSSGEIANKNYNTIKNLETGLWFNPPVKNQKILTLNELLENCYDLQLNINLEIKCEEKYDAKNWARSLNDFIKNNVPNFFPIPLVSSFNLKFLQYLRKLNANIPIGYLVESFEHNTIQIAIKNNFTTIHCDVKNILQKNIDDCKKYNFPVLLYTVNDADVGRYWLNKGIDAIFTDNPNLFLVKNSIVT